MKSFWLGKRVLVTGHTGFKGTWLCELLLARGAQVFGAALPPEPEHRLFDQVDLAARIDHAVVDVREASAVTARIAQTRPDIVLHLAAQALVRRSYREPVETWATNLQGALHVLDGVHRLDRLCAVVVVTTDKVYENTGGEFAYRETDPLGGHDPYAASKAALELAVSSYRRSFFQDGLSRVATARAGNVIGGGDWAQDRILPDLARAFGAGRALMVRNPHAIRPWQHVLDPLNGYLLLAEALHCSEDPVFQQAFNFGPEACGQRSVDALLALATEHWPGEVRRAEGTNELHEADRLRLTIERARAVLDWRPRWDVEQAVKATIDWYRRDSEGENPRDLTMAQIQSFEAEACG